MEGAEKREQHDQTNFSKMEKLLRIAKGEGDAASDEVLKCLQQDREVPVEIMDQLAPVKRTFVENWNRLCKKLKDLSEEALRKPAPRRKRRQAPGRDA
jgi:hypothetical protein